MQAALRLGSWPQLYQPPKKCSTHEHPSVVRERAGQLAGRASSPASAITTGTKSVHNVRNVRQPRWLGPPSKTWQNQASARAKPREVQHTHLGQARTGSVSTHLVRLRCTLQRARRSKAARCKSTPSRQNERASSTTRRTCLTQSLVPRLLIKVQVWGAIDPQRGERGDHAQLRHTVPEVGLAGYSVKA